MSHYYFENTPHGTRKNGTKLNTKTHYDYIFREKLEEIAKKSPVSDRIIFTGRYNDKTPHLSQ